MRLSVELTERELAFLRALSRPARTGQPRTLGAKFVATGVLAAAIELLAERGRRHVRRARRRRGRDGGASAQRAAPRRHARGPAQGGVMSSSTIAPRSTRDRACRGCRGRRVGAPESAPELRSGADCPGARSPACIWPVTAHRPRSPQVLRMGWGSGVGEQVPGMQVGGAGARATPGTSRPGRSESRGARNDQNGHFNSERQKRRDADRRGRGSREMRRSGAGAGGVG